MQSADRSAARALDRRFVLVAAELGFIRAHQLLDEMSQAIDAFGFRSAERKDPRRRAPGR